MSLSKFPEKARRAAPVALAAALALLASGCTSSKPAAPLVCPIATIAPGLNVIPQFGPGAVGLGYDMAFIGLYLHLTGGGVTVDPAEALAWFASPDGLRFITAASTAWGEASAAAGTDPGAARAAAERTTAAYTAVPE